MKTEQERKLEQAAGQFQERSARIAINTLAQAVRFFIVNRRDSFLANSGYHGGEVTLRAMMETIGDEVTRIAMGGSELAAGEAPEGSGSED